MNKKQEHIVIESIFPNESHDIANGGGMATSTSYLVTWDLSVSNNS